MAVVKRALIAGQRILIERGAIRSDQAKPISELLRAWLRRQVKTAVELGRLAKRED